MELIGGSTLTHAASFSSTSVRANAVASLSASRVVRTNASGEPAVGVTNFLLVLGAFCLYFAVFALYSEVSGGILARSHSEKDADHPTRTRRRRRLAATSAACDSVCGRADRLRDHRGRAGWRKRPGGDAQSTSAVSGARNRAGRR